MKLTFIASLVAVQVLGSSMAAAGTIADAQSDWYEKYKKQANAPDPAKMLLNEDKEPGLKEGFVNLFNGKDLTGWTPKGGKGSFEVKDRMIVGTRSENSRSQSGKTWFMEDDNDDDNQINEADAYQSGDSSGAGKHGSWSAGKGIPFLV